MLHPTTHQFFALAALGVALGSSALARRGAGPETANEPAPATVDAEALAGLLAYGPAEVVVLSLDEPKHPLRFAQPAAIYGATDEALVQAAPRHRPLILAGTDVVRADRLARRLRASGRDVRVLAGGLDSWDQLIAESPAVPPDGASAATWQRYRQRLGLQRAFGNEAGAVSAPVSAPKPLAPTGAVAKKREGC